MMTQAFYTGVSGLKTHSFGIDVVSDNIANINTVGFRGNDYEFTPLFENMMHTQSGKSSVDSSTGLGTRVQTTALLSSQGSPILTNRSTDLMIMGDGWFGVEDQKGKQIFTRDGAFGFDENDELVSDDGMYVLGTKGGNIDGETLTKTLDEVPLGDIGSQEKLRFPKTLTYPPEASTKAEFKGNIGNGEELDDNGKLVRVPVAMSAGVIDPNGDRNDLRLEFKKKDIQNPPGSQWNVTATVTSLDGQTLYDTQEGEVIFDSMGALVSTTLTSINNNGADVKINLGKKFNGVVSLTNVKTGASTFADGTIGGDLRGYDINKNGEVTATFTNGKQSSVGRIAVYHFGNNQGLHRLSGTNFMQTDNSGKPFFHKDQNGQNIIGTDITNFKLEGSNYSVSTGLTELIILQRAYDANAKSVTTADQMIQKALQMGA